MLCPAAAVCLLAVLGPGLSLPAEDTSQAGFALCSHCFYRQTPPRGFSAGAPLRPLCRRAPGGRDFASLHDPNCDTDVFFAFHLGPGWTERQGQEGGQLVAEEEENLKGAVPALLRGAADPSQPVSPADPPLRSWDSTIAALVRSSILPPCSSSGGELYILTGVGAPGATEDGGEGCHKRPLWSAVCCSVPEGNGGFGVGFISEDAGGERQVTLEELEETLGVSGLFYEGCAGVDGETGGVAADFSRGDPHQIDANERVGEGSDTVTQDSNTYVDQREEPVAARDAPTDDTTPEGALERSGEPRRDVTHSEASESTDEAATEETKSGSIVVYVLSTTFSILTAPLRPVISRVTDLPGQVTYVLQEDLGVLSALPGDTFSLLHLLTSDLLSWLGSAAETLLGVGETCFLSGYYCASSMLGELVNSCHTGVTGMGTLAGDTVGMFGDTLGNAWWVTKLFGGRLWEQSGGYVETVVTEMGGQAKAVGGGLVRLAWRSGTGVGNVFGLGGGLVMGVVDMVLGAVGEGFGRDSE